MPSPNNPATITGVSFSAVIANSDNQTKNINLNFTGYSLPDGTADTYDGKKGDFVQRVGKFVLDGTESFSDLSNLGNVSRVIVRGNNLSSVKNYIGYSTHFTGNLSWDENSQHFYTNGRDTVLFIPNNLLSSQTLDGIKSWLAAQATTGTPVTVYYRLEKPIAYNQKADIPAFEGQTTVTGADTVDIIEGRVLRVADCLPYEIVRSNPNLLDNWYFGSPINQRGQTTYTTAGYCIDRWKLDVATGGASVNLCDGYIRCKKQSNGTDVRPYQSLSQIVENPNRFALKTMTLSILSRGPGTGQMLYYVNGSVYSVKDVLLNAKDDWTLHYFSVRLPASVNYFRVYFYFDTSKTLKTGYTDFLAAKLEEGNSQTLARKVGNQWVPNDVPPNPATELLKCQRYFYISNQDVNNIGQSIRISQGTHCILFKATMRTNPVIELYGTDKPYFIANLISYNGFIINNTDKTAETRAFDFTANADL